MTEAKPSPEQGIARVRDELNQDGHFVENATAFIVSLVADIRDRSASPIDAEFKLLDALGGKPNEASETAGRIMVLKLALGNPELAEAATKVGIYSSKNQRKQIKEAHKQGFEQLRGVVLNMTVPPKSGESPVTLSTKIQSLPTTK